MKFLLLHHGKLGLPYSFPVLLSLASSPLIAGRALLVHTEEDYELVGAAGFVIGTGRNDYADRHVCQLETAFVLPAHRGSSLFSLALAALLDLMEESSPEVTTVQFWSAVEPTAGFKRLRSRLGKLPGTEIEQMNGLELCRLRFAELRRFSKQLGDAGRPQRFR